VGLRLASFGCSLLLKWVELLALKSVGLYSHSQLKVASPQIWLEDLAKLFYHQHFTMVYVSTDRKEVCKQHLTIA
jgi:hypothetical protein